MKIFIPEYSLKKIPHPIVHAFQLSLTEKIEVFIKRIWWKTYFYLNSSDIPNRTKKEVYNLKSQRRPPNNKLLDPFEADLFKLIKKITFRKDHNHFLTKLNKDIKELKNSKYIWVRADKSRNIYKINSSNYHKILKNRITNTYKIDHNDTISQINDDTLKFTNKLHIEDRLGKFNMKVAYILFKDHKPNFENKLQSRLINPSKTELGIISKILFEMLYLIHKKYP